MLTTAVAAILVGLAPLAASASAARTAITTGDRWQLPPPAFGWPMRAEFLASSWPRTTQI